MAKKKDILSEDVKSHRIEYDARYQPVNDIIAQIEEFLDSHNVIEFEIKFSDFQEQSNPKIQQLLERLIMKTKQQGIKMNKIYSFNDSSSTYIFKK